METCWLATKCVKKANIHISKNKLPVNPSDTLLYNPPDLLEYVGVFLIHPVCQVSPIIQDLISRRKRFVIFL